MTIDRESGARSVPSSSNRWSADVNVMHLDCIYRDTVRKNVGPCRFLKYFHKKLQ